MSEDPREKLARTAAAISAPSLDIPARSSPTKKVPAPPPQRPGPLLRDGLRDREIQHLAALIRGGVPYDEATATIPGVSPETFVSWKPTILELAAEPGPVAEIAPPPTPEEQDEQEAERLRAWLGPFGQPPDPTAPRCRFETILSDGRVQTSDGNRRW